MKKEDQNQIDKYGMIKTGDMEWTSQTHISVVKLTPKEIKACEYGNIDEEKMLLVKRCLVNGWSNSKIYKEYGIARTTIDKYKKILKSSLQTTSKLHSNYIQTTNTKKSVVWFLLIFNTLDNQTTHLFFILVFSLIGVPFFVHRWQIWAFERREARRKEIRPLRIDFYTAMDFKYRRSALVAKNEKEKLYFKHLLREYKNTYRVVFLKEMNAGETAINHALRREKVAEQYNINNALLVRNAELKYLAEHEKLYKSGKLDYFYSHDKEKREASRLWLVEFTRPIVERNAKDNLEVLTTQS